MTTGKWMVVVGIVVLVALIIAVAVGMFYRSQKLEEANWETHRQLAVLRAEYDKVMRECIKYKRADDSWKLYFEQNKDALFAKHGKHRAPDGK